jgi:hypothetical protein
MQKKFSQAKPTHHIVPMLCVGMLFVTLCVTERGVSIDEFSSRA